MAIYVENTIAAARQSAVVLALLCSFLVIAGSASAGNNGSIFDSNGTDVDIPDDGSPGGWIASTITITDAPSNAVVTSIDVHFEVIHTYSSDLVIDINADPSEEKGNYTLWDMEGGSSDNPSGTEYGINTYNGLSVNRTWYLYANDFVAQDSGYIDYWWIEVHYSVPSADPPFIDDVDPDPVPGLKGDQIVEIHGSGFEPGAVVHLMDVDCPSQPCDFPNEPATFISDDELRIEANFTNTTSTWSVQVENPDGQLSNIYTFEVVETVEDDPPSISSVSPNPVPGLEGDQPFHIYGDNFTPDSDVVLNDLTFNDGPFPFLNPTYHSSGHLEIEAYFTNNTATWTAQVIDSNGPDSNVYTFQVEAMTGGNCDDVISVDGFDFPVGYPNGTGWNHGDDCIDTCGSQSCPDGYDFLEPAVYSVPNCNGVPPGCIFHTGEDWNQNGGGDCGATVYAIANGVVVSPVGCSWGTLMIRHDNVPGYGTIWSLYGHLNPNSPLNPAMCDTIARGQPIGELASIPSGTPCHLHLEIRTIDPLNSGWGPCCIPAEPDGADINWILDRYLDPSDFINANRPDDTTTTTFSGQVTWEASGVGIGGALVSWGPHNVTADSEGFYTFLNVPCGTHDIEACAPPPAVDACSIPTPYTPPGCGGGMPPPIECSGGICPQGVAGGGLFEPGDIVEVYNTDGLGLRAWNDSCSEPDSYIVKPDGTTGVILDGPYCCDGFNRWQIQWDDDNSIRWSAEGDSNTGDMWLLEIEPKVNVNIASFIVSPTSPMVGEEIDITVQYCNDGSFDVTDIQVSFSIDSEVIDTQSDSLLPQGNCDDRSTTSEPFAKAGTYPVSATISVGGEAVDSASTSITVSADPGGDPDVVIDSIWVVPSSPNAGEVATLNAEICNNGTGEATDVVVEYLINGVNVATDQDNTMPSGDCDTENASYSFPNDGTYTYTVQLFVEDNFIDSTSIQVLVKVSPTSPDINSDGMVNGADLGLLLGEWGCTTNCIGDINGDGVVDGSDLGLLLGDWEVEDDPPDPTVHNVPGDFSTIQAAIDNASADDEIIVAPGTYTENIDFLGKAVTIRASDGPVSTIIDGGDSGSVVTANSGEGTDSRLEGFTITNGNSDKGGGIQIIASSPTIENCLIINNQVIKGDFPSGGGGIYLQESGSSLINCQISGNLASEFLGGNGGGIYIFVSDVSLTDCIISDNEAIGVGGSAGGGLYLVTSTVAFEACEISNNTATLELPSLCRGGGSQVIRGGGLSIAGDCQVTMTNVIVADNEAVPRYTQKLWMTHESGGVLLSIDEFYPSNHFGDQLVTV